LICAIGFIALISGVAEAAKPIEIPVEVIDVEQNAKARWEEIQDVSHDKVEALTTAAEKAGGSCHELTSERIVVCYFPGSRTAGIDWDKLSKGLVQAK
jgi:hypothetical protein